MRNRSCLAVASLACVACLLPAASGPSLAVAEEAPAATPTTTTTGGQSTTAAQGSTTEITQENSQSLIDEVLFPWVDEGGFDDNWLDGLGLVSLGIVGALVTIYLFVGGFLPSMGGKAEYEAIRIEIRDLEDRRDKQIALREGYAEGQEGLAPERRAEATQLTADLGGIIEQKEMEASKLRRQLISIGFPIYVVLGGAFAVLFATNALQALLIGFGWTAIADRIGLKRELEEKNEIRGEAIGNLAQVAQTSDKKLEQVEAAERETLTALASLRAELADALGDSPTDQKGTKE